MKIKFLLIFSALIALSSCTKKAKKQSSGKQIASIGEESLYQSDIETILPKGLSQKDSARFVGKYIDKWATATIKLNAASLNLNDDELSKIEWQVEEYRSDLITNAYEAKLIDEKLNKEVTNQEITSYYNNNKRSFTLKSELVKCRYMKLPKDSVVLKQEDLNDLKQNFYSKNLDDRDKLSVQLLKISSEHELNDSTWMTFRSLQNKIPFKQGVNTEEYLRRNRKINLEDSLNYYFVNIHKVMYKGGFEPQKNVENTIKNIILNQRKVKLMKELETEMLKKSKKTKELIIHEKA